MVDTVKLYTEEYALRKPNRLHTQVTTKDGGEVVSEKTFLNFSDGFGVDVEGGRVWVRCSLPKQLRKTSLFEVSESDFPRAVSLIESRLDSAGIDIDRNNLSDFQLSRVDFCRNIEVAHRPLDYVSAFSGLSFPRMEKSKIANETLTHFNTVREFAIYNKVLEVRENNPTPEVKKIVAGLPENILRLESRLKRHTAVTKVGVRTFRDVFDRETSRRVVLSDFDTLTRSVSDKEVTETFDFDARVNLLRSLRTRRGGWKDFLCVLSVRGELELLGGDWSVWHSLLSEAGYKRSQVFAIVRQLKGYHGMSLRHLERNLVEEVREKIAA